MFNDGSGEFTNGPVLTVGTRPQTSAYGDFDGDGDLDIAVVNDGSASVSIITNGPTVDVSPDHPGVPVASALLQNFPNPFNPTTRISYSVASRGLVVLRIYDLMGREVVTLQNGGKEAGHYHIDWNAENMASGVYFCRLLTGHFFRHQEADPDPITVGEPGSAGSIRLIRSPFFCTIQTVSGTSRSAFCWYLKWTN